MNVLLCGGTGFLGNKLGAMLVASGHKVWCTTRNIEESKGKVSYPCEWVEWNSSSVIPESKIASIQAVFNLAGAGIADQRWSQKRKQELRLSRIQTTKYLVDSFQSLSSLQFFLSVSAVGIYGDQGDVPISEDSPSGRGFVSDLCLEWEAEAMRLKALNPDVRIVTPRLGVVLAQGEGFLKRLEPIFRAGLGGRLGDGQQYVSWIHLQDLLQFFKTALGSSNFVGTYNLTAPSPSKNWELTRDLAKALHRPAWIPVPKLALKIAFGEMSEVLLGGQRVLPQRLESQGFDFKFRTLHQALKEIY